MRRAAENATAAGTPNARKLMGIYTRTGDKGKTSLYQGKRISKGDLRVEVYGSVDELNSSIGLALSEIKDAKTKKELAAIQNDLFEIGAKLANPQSRDAKLGRYLKDRVSVFEKMIDSLTVKLPRLSNFILPGGGMGGALIHFARTVCRRCERRIVELSGRETVEQEIIMYINRLSDLLFMMARFINYKENKKEFIWSKR